MRIAEIITLLMVLTEFYNMRSLRSKISVNLLLLLFVTILATHIVIVTVMSNEFVKDKINRERQIFSSAASGFFHQPSSFIDIIGIRDWNYVCLMAENGDRYCYGDNQDGMWDDIIDMTAASLDLNQSQIKYQGETWGVFGKQNKFVIISDVLTYDSQTLGAGTVVVMLDDVYHTIRKSQKFVVMYLSINLVILFLFALYRFSGLILRPLKKMVKMTEGYRDTGQLFIPAEKRHPEFFQLSDALNRMMQHIEADKNKLLNSLVLLEKANTDLKKAQAEMIRAEKLASIGRLSAGLSHEIGNPIGIVLGYLGLLKQRPFVRTDDVAQDYIERSESEINRINVIVRQLLDFSRPAAANIVAFKLHDLLSDVVAMMTHQPLMKNIRIKCEFSASSDTIVGDPQQIRQVLLNLLINAADAIAVSLRPDAGEIRLITVSLPGNPYIRLMVADNGAGIDQENIDNIFDPFYTTKEPGKGTGLGLSVSYMIIEQAGGTLNVETEPGRGTIMTITLPLPDPAALAACEKSPINETS
ncbi:MAG: sensor histidine kinase [Desulfobacteraceae bacterium]|jgi:signal transduction histidine kinase|nr:MAG: sensor histidine kinase [Desulfobacteraceae bacterium]